MASGGKRSAGDRVLESKHVIGLFLLMLLFSGVFFSLGYVMGRNQYDGQVRAASNGISKSEPASTLKTDVVQKKGVEESASATDSDPSTSSSASAWNFPATNSPANPDPHLDVPSVSRSTAPGPKSTSAKSIAQPQPALAHPAAKNVRTLNAAPLVPSGAYVIQVAALLRQDDALAIASSLQKKHYAVYVQTSHKDKYYRVQVGPFKDQKSADAAKKGLEGEGFKAFYVKH